MSNPAKSRCDVCGKEYRGGQTTILRWVITPGVDFSWCRRCDKDTGSHDGLHRWQNAFMDTMVVAARHQEKAPSTSDAKEQIAHVRPRLGAGKGRPTSRL